MAATGKRIEEPEPQDEEILEENEDLADTILEQGQVYREIAERRDLEKSYDKLEPEDKWWYALEALHSRAGVSYSSPRQLLQEYYQGDLDLDEVPWNDTEWGDQHDLGSETLEENVDFSVTGVIDGRVTARAEAYLEDRDEEGIVYRLLDDPEEWEKD